MFAKSLKGPHLFFLLLFICLLHLPFVFAKVKPGGVVASFSPGAILPADTTVCASVTPLPLAVAADIYDSLQLSSLGLSRQVFDYAIKGFEYMKQEGKLKDQRILSIVDFSKSSCKKRLFVIDTEKYQLLFNTYVAHGVNSGQEYARQFSNLPESNKSSLGFYITADTYPGKHGYSLHLMGMEKGINDNAYNRDIVMHGAEYVSETLIRAQGFLGRSQGCPAVPEKLHKQIIDKIKNGTCLFIFGEDKNYFRRSALIKMASQLLAYN